MHGPAPGVCFQASRSLQRGLWPLTMAPVVTFEAHRPHSKARDDESRRSGESCRGAEGEMGEVEGVMLVGRLSE
jgi:hypothetical protein